MMIAEGNKNKDNASMNVWSFAGKLWVVMVVLGLSTFVFVRARESASALEGWELDNQQEGNLRVGRLDSSLLKDVKIFFSSAPQFVHQASYFTLIDTHRRY